MIVLVTTVGHATGASAAAATLASAASDSARAGLLIEFGDVRPPRPSLLATAAARALEEQLAAHLPGTAVASRGRICQLTLGSEGGEGDAAVDRIAAALPLARDASAVIHVSPCRFQAVLDERRIQPSGALVRADLTTHRALTALIVRDLMDRGIEAVVLKRSLPWPMARAAALGLVPAGLSSLPARVGRLLP